MGQWQNLRRGQQPLAAFDWVDGGASDGDVKGRTIGPVLFGIAFIVTLVTAPGGKRGWTFRLRPIWGDHGVTIFRWGKL